MHEPHRGRAPVAARAGMEFFEGVEVLAPDAAALGQQGGEVIRQGAKGRGLFKQYRVTGERLPESPAESHRVAFGASPFAEILIRRQNLALWPLTNEVTAWA